MDWTPIAVAGIAGLCSVAAAIAGSEWLAKRRRTRNGGETCCHHCRDRDRLEDRMKAMEHWQVDARLRFHDHANHIQNVMGHASRLEREARDFRQTVNETLARIDQKLDALMGWMRPKP